MKKPLFSLVLLALAGPALAQPGPTGPWVTANVSNVNTPASFALYQLVTLSPTFTWGIAYDVTNTSTSPPINSSLRVSNAAGNEFGFSSIAGTSGFKPTNLSVPAGVPGNTVAFCGQYSLGGTSGRGGEVLRTINSGASWQRITTLTQFAGPASFCDWVYSFDAGHVIAAGDPNPVPSAGVGQFEFLYTSNANATPASAVTWTRATTPAPYDANEYPLIGSYTAVGNTIWAGTSHEAAGGPSGASRVLRSTDQGHTWTAHNTPITLGQVQHLAFKDALNGLAYTRTATSTELMTTADGGLTWTLQSLPDPTTADTLRGKFYLTGVTAIPGVGYISYGAAVATQRNATNFGASFSPTGVGKSWTDIDKGNHRYLSASFVPCGPAGYQGYLGGTTAPATAANPTGGQGGLYQIAPGACAAVPLARRSGSPRQPALAVLPNPSPDGHFQVQVPAGRASRLTVLDALGRTVSSRELAATASDTAVPLHLQGQPAGVYTLRLTSAAGMATLKLVLQ